MARPVARLVRAMLALGTPWGLWVALPETYDVFTSLLIDETERAMDDFYRAINAHLIADLPLTEG